MATVSTPQAVSQSASASRSAVKVPKRRTGSGSQSGGTATQWTPSWTSIPAARGFVTVSAGWGLGGEEVVDRRGAGNRRLAAIRTSAGRDERGGQEGEKGMQSPKRDQVWPGL